MTTNAKKHFNTIKELNEITESAIELAVEIREQITYEEKEKFYAIIRRLQIHITVSIEAIKNDLPF